MLDREGFLHSLPAPVDPNFASTVYFVAREDRHEHCKEGQQL